MVASKLKELGLTKGEIKVYLALLKIGISTKGPIASKAKVSESKVYEILDRLTAKGLVSNAMKKKGARQVKQFKAANPILLKDFLNKSSEPSVVGGLINNSASDLSSTFISLFNSGFGNISIFFIFSSIADIFSSIF